MPFKLNRIALRTSLIWSIILSEKSATFRDHALVPIIVDLEQRERAEHVRHRRRRRRMQVLAVEMGKACHPEQAEAALHLVLQEFEHAHERALAAGGERVALHPAEPDEIGA